MTAQNPRPEGARQPRDAAHWAHYVEALKAPEGAVSLNVEGRRVVGPLQGFGKMWQKTYRARLTGASASPAEVVGVWRQRFPEPSGFGKGFRALGWASARRRCAARGPQRRDGALFRRGVLHLHDARGAPFLRLDHVQRLRGRRRHDGGPGLPAYTRQRPALRACDAPRAPQGGGQKEPGSILRRERRSRDPRGLRGPEAAVATVREHPAQRHRALGSPRGNRAAAPIASPIGGSSP